MKSSSIKEAFESVQADIDLADRIIDSASGKPLRRRGHSISLRAVGIGCLVGMTMVGGSAFALTNSGFFASAWGNHGNGEAITWSITDSGKNIYTYSRVFGDGTAAECLEDDVQEIGLTVRGNGYTLALQEMVIDENGCGAATFTLSNPHGVSYYKPAAEAGELVLNGGEGEQRLDAIGMRYGSESADVHLVIDKDASTKTTVSGTMYFAPWDRERDLQQTISWYMCWSEGGETGETLESATSEYKVERYTAAKTLKKEDSALEVSPFSILVHLDDFGSDATVNREVIEYKDGTKRTIEDDGTGESNAYFSLIRDNGEMTLVPTELIEVDQIAAVSIEGVRSVSKNGSDVSEPFTAVYS